MRRCTVLDSDNYSPQHSSSKNPVFPLIIQEAAANTPSAQNKQECTFSEILATPVHTVLLSLLLTDDVLCNTNRFLFKSGDRGNFSCLAPWTLQKCVVSK